MGLLKNKYGIFFTGFLVSILLVFFWVRPLNSPWHKFISGDGLGYYSYLPAKFIFRDPGYDFKWFNKAYQANYTTGAFDNPQDNLLVKYGNKKINKFYPGLSFTWFPFFAAAHVCVKVLHYPADGFSQPYQLFIGLASLFYLFVGLIFLRKLMLLLFENERAGLLVPVAIFYGTPLFTYALKANSMSHAYSFTFMVLFTYYLSSFFRRNKDPWRDLLLCILFFFITVCIRPLNGLVLLAIPAFVPVGFMWSGKNMGKFRPFNWVIIFVTLLAIVYQCRVMYIQTGSLFSYTYTDEKFNFTSPKFFEALISYHMGLFVYVPLVFLSLFGLPFMEKRVRFVLMGLFLLVVYIYSSWWYWPICKRAFVDFYFIPAIFLGALVTGLQGRVQKIWTGFFILLSVIYFQFKDFQLRNGVLDDFVTYREVFWKDFFSVKKAHRFLVPPSTVLETVKFVQSFEDSTFSGKTTELRVFEGKRSLRLDGVNFASCISDHGFPALFAGDGSKKIRYSFECHVEPGVKALHLFIQFFDRQHKMVKEVAHYINHEDLNYDKWEHVEIGYEIMPGDSLSSETVGRIKCSAWNVEGKGRMFIDNATTEFILTDRRYETLK